MINETKTKIEENSDTVNLLKNCINQNIKDVYVTGYSELRDGFNFFSPMWWWYFVELDNCLLCLDSSDETKELQIYLCENIKCNFDIEEDDIFTVSSVEKDITAQIMEFELFYSKKSSNICALGILLKSNKYILFDSLTWSGITIGNEKNKNDFLQNDRFYVVKVPQ